MGAKPLDLRVKKAAPPRTLPPREPRELKRPISLRARRRRRRLLLGGLGLIGVGATLFAVHFISYMPQYTIQAIEVSGTSAVDPIQVQAEVEHALGEGGSFISPRCIFSYDAKKIERVLRAATMRIARVQVSRANFFSTTLKIAIDERAPFAHWCADGTSCYLIDETGFVFATALPVETVAEPFVFSGGIASSTNPLGQYVAPAHFPSALAIMRALGQAGFTPVSAQFDSQTDFLIRTEKGIAIYASFGAEPSDLVRNLKLVLASDELKDHIADVEYIDLRFGQRVFYKLKGQDIVAQ